MKILKVLIYILNSKFKVLQYITIALGDNSFDPKFHPKFPQLLNYILDYCIIVLAFLYL